MSSHPLVFANMDYRQHRDHVFSTKTCVYRIDDGLFPAVFLTSCKRKNELHDW